MDLGIAGKCALVIGASRGIGRASALGLAKAGARVIAVARSANDIATLVREIGGSKKGHVGIVKDLCTEGAPRELYEEIQKQDRRVDIVVYSIGGTLGVRNTFFSIEEWRKVSRTNFEVVVELNHYLVPLMQERKWGRVVHVSSIAAKIARGSNAYVAAKSALNAYTRNLGCAVAQDGVVVTAVMPGAVRFKNNIWDRLSTDSPDQAHSYLNERMAIKRFANPDEIANLIVFLCSENASFLTGCILPIDGGTS